LKVKIDKRLQVLSGNNSRPTLEKLIIELSQHARTHAHSIIEKLINH